MLGVRWVDLLPKPAEMEELLMSLSRGEEKPDFTEERAFLTKGQAEKRRNWLQKGRGLTAGQVSGCQSKLGMGNVGNIHDASQRKEGMSLGMLHRAGVHIGFCREVKAGISVLFSRVRAFDMTLKRGIWSLEQSPGASLGNTGKPEEASHEQPQKYFSWNTC